MDRILERNVAKSSFPLRMIFEAGTESGGILLTTEKDYLRIEERYKVNIKFLKIKVEIQNCDKFIEEIKKII